MSTETAPATTPEPVDAEAMVSSLSGFDELAIAARFKAELGELSQTMMMRALAFVIYRRDGKDDAEAYGAAMRATLGEVKGLFAAGSDEDDDPGKA